MQLLHFDKLPYFVLNRYTRKYIKIKNSTEDIEVKPMKLQEIQDLQQLLGEQTGIETENNIQMIFQISKKLDELINKREEIS